MFAVGSVKEAVGPRVLVGIAEREFVADRVILQESEGVADSDVVVCARNETWAIEVRSDHDKEVRDRTGAFGHRVRRGRLPIGW